MCKYFCIYLVSYKFDYRNLCVIFQQNIYGRRNGKRSKIIIFKLHSRFIILQSLYNLCVIFQQNIYGMKNEKRSKIIIFKLYSRFIILQDFLNYYFFLCGFLDFDWSCYIGREISKLPPKWELVMIDYLIRKFFWDFKISKDTLWYKNKNESYRHSFNCL